MLYLLPFVFLQLPLDILVATVEALLLGYLVNAEDEVFGLLILFVVLMLDLQLLLAMELALEARYLPLLVDVGDTPRLSTLSAHLSMCDPVPPLLPYGEFFLRPLMYVESSKGCTVCVGSLQPEGCLAGEREGLGSGGPNPRTRLVTLHAVFDICLLPSTVIGSSTGGLGAGMVGLRSPLLLPMINFHLDGFLVTVGVGSVASGGMGGTGGTGSITYPLPETLEDLLISLASDWEASARVSRVRSTGSG
jgi:hypothetical protein